MSTGDNLKAEKRRAITEVDRNYRSLQALKNERNFEAMSRRARLVRRDAEYAAHAAPVKSVMREGVRFETRGNRVCASSVGLHRQFTTDKGVAYFA